MRESACCRRMSTRPGAVEGAMPSMEAEGKKSGSRSQSASRLFAARSPETSATDDPVSSTQGGRLREERPGNRGSDFRVCVGHPRTSTRLPGVVRPVDHWCASRRGRQRRSGTRGDLAERRSVCRRRGNLGGLLQEDRCRSARRRCTRRRWARPTHALFVIEKTQ